MELHGAGLRWLPLVSAEVRIVWKCKSLGKTYYFRTWSRPKSDPTLQMQISMQTQVQIRMQTQFKVSLASVWVRLKRFLPPFGSVFASFLDRLGFASANASAHAGARAIANAIVI